VRRQIQIVFWGLQSELDPRPWNANYLRIRISKRNSHFLRDDEVSVCVPCAFSAKVSGISSTFPPIYSSSNTIAQKQTHSIPSRLRCWHPKQGGQQGTKRIEMPSIERDGNTKTDSQCQPAIPGSRTVKARDLVAIEHAFIVGRSDPDNHSIFSERR